MFEEKLPNFIIIGAAKAGTTSVYNYMNQHPQIFMCPIKEPGYFAYSKEEDSGLPGTLNNQPYKVKTLKEYTKLFKGAKREKIIGEATPIYLPSPFAAERIKNLLPDVKLLVILRNPVERTLSRYMMKVRFKHVSWEVGDEFKKININNNNSILQGGFYFNNLKRYFDIFSKNQIKVCLFDDLQKNTLSTIQEIYTYLEVDPHFEPDTSVQHNIGGFPKKKKLNNFLIWIRKTGNKKNIRILRKYIPNLLNKIYWKIYNNNLDNSIKCPDYLRKQLIKLFKDDILKLQDLIQRDLSKWLII